MITLELENRHLMPPCYLRQYFDWRKGRNKAFLHVDIEAWLREINARYTVRGDWKIGGFNDGSIIPNFHTGKRRATITFYDDGAAVMFKMSEWWESEPEPIWI